MSSSTLREPDQALSNTAVSKDVAGIISKREFKKKLGEAEALRQWPQFHALVEREIAQARKRLAAGTLPQTEREAYEAAQNYVQALLPRDAPADLRDVTADHLAAGYPIDPETDAPINARPVDRHAINLLRSRPGSYPTPPPSLSDALNLYLNEHLNADSSDVDSPVVPLAQRVSLYQNHLVQSQIRNGTLEPLVRRLKLLQPLELIAVPAALFLSPSIIGLHGHADLSHSIGNRLALALQNFNLP